MKVNDHLWLFPDINTKASPFYVSVSICNVLTNLADFTHRNFHVLPDIGITSGFAPVGCTATCSSIPTKTAGTSHGFCKS